MKAKFLLWLHNWLVGRVDKKQLQWTRIGDVEREHFPISRYYPFLMDEEFEDLPWWVRVNVLLHKWSDSDLDRMHDHPRWTITIVLSGEMIECTPWERKILKPGSIVIRSRKCIHRFELVSDEVWTVFIVGRRKHKQNLYTVEPQS